MECIGLGLVKVLIGLVDGTNFALDFLSREEVSEGSWKASLIVASWYVNWGGKGQKFVLKMPI